MATVLPPFTTLPSYPGIYTDQPSDGPDTTDIPQPDSESEFFEGAQSVINEAYGDIIRAWGNAIMANAVSMDDVPEFLREQVQGYIDYTTGQTEEVVEPEEVLEDITQDTVEAEQDAALELTLEQLNANQDSYLQQFAASSAEAVKAALKGSDDIVKSLNDWILKNVLSGGGVGFRIYGKPDGRKTIVLGIPAPVGDGIIELEVTDENGNLTNAQGNIFQQSVERAVKQIEEQVTEIPEKIADLVGDTVKVLQGKQGNIGSVDLSGNILDIAGNVIGSVFSPDNPLGDFIKDVPWIAGQAVDLINQELSLPATETSQAQAIDLSGIGSELGVNGGEIIDGPLLPGGGEVVVSPVQDGIPTVVRDPNAGLAPIIKDPIKQIDTTEPIAVTGTRDPDAVLVPIIKDPLKQDTQTETIKQDGIAVTGTRDPDAVLTPIIKDPLKQDTQTETIKQDGIAVTGTRDPNYTGTIIIKDPIKQIRTDVTTTDLLPPAPFQDVEQEITQDQVVVEPPITDDTEIITDEPVPPPEPPPEPPPFVAPPPPASSGGGGMLGGTPKGYMADLPYQLPRFMGVPYDPGNPVEQLNRIILEGLFSQ